MRISIKSNIYSFIVLTSILLFPLNSWAAFNVYISLTINGNDIDGDSTTQSIGGIDISNMIEATSAGYSVSVPVNSDGSLGRHSYRPFTITKRVDRSSPLLFKALTVGESVDRLEAKYFRVNSNTGAPEHFLTILLEDGFVTSIIPTSPSTTDSQSATQPVTELVSFMFNRITMIYEDGGIQHTDQLR